VWDLDEVLRLELPAMGLQVVPVPLEKAARAFEEGRLDGYVAVPTAALAFQWSAQSHYVSDLRFGFLRGCLLVSNRAYDQLPLEAQQSLRAANAKLLMRLEDLGRAQDDALLGRLFDKQGVKKTQVSSGFRSEFYELARNARDKLGAQLVPPALLQRVMAMLADYRAEHRSEDASR
jgi:TRAP-type C4-dicarboxylate transport system substrate-binding protein